MKILLKVLAINICILFLLGYPASIMAQVPEPGTLGVAPEPNRSIPERAHRVIPASPSAPNAPDFNSRLQALIERANPPAAAPTFERNSPSWKKQIKEVSFDGMPMSEVIKWLREQFPEVNFVSAPEVEDVPVKLNLHNVTLDDIFVALNITSRGELVANPMSEKMVSFYYRPMFPREQVQRKISRAYSLAGYLSGRSPEETERALKDLEDALAVSWKMLQQANPDDRNFQPPKLNLHAPTKMLIAVGDGDQLEVIERFISQLERRPNPSLSPFPSASVPPPRTLLPPAQIPARPLITPSTNKPPSTK